MKKTKETPSVKPQTATAAYNTRKSSQRQEDQSVATEASSKQTLKELLSQGRRNSVSAPTISSESKRKEPIRSSTVKHNTKKASSQSQGQKADSNSTILKKSKVEIKKESKRESKREDREEKAPYGMDSPTPKDIQTSKRHAAEDSLLNKSNTASPAPFQPSTTPGDTNIDPNIPGNDDITDTILLNLGEEDDKEKPSPKQRKSSKKSTSKKSVTSSKSIEPKPSSPNINVPKSPPTEELLPVQDNPKQLQQSQVSPKSSPSVRSAEGSQSNATSHPLEHNPLPRRPRPESDTEQLPGEKKVKKVKDISDTAIIASSRHVLKPIQKDISLPDLKAIALVMLQNETFQKKCEWALLSNVETSVWLCHRELTLGVAKKFGFTREEMPERERQCRLSTLQHDTTKEMFGFEEIYLNTNPVVKEKKNEKRRTKTATTANVTAAATQSQSQSSSKAPVAGNVGEQSLLSGITGQDITTVRSSEFGDHTPIGSQKLLHIPLTMRFLDSTILDFLKYLVHDHWTVDQLKVKFYRSGHQPIFQTILDHQANLRIYEEGVADTDSWLCQAEREKITQLKTEREEAIRAMPILPPTNKIDDVLAEAGFGSN